MFDMKYDKDGMPIKNPELEQSFKDMPEPEAKQEVLAQQTTPESEVSNTLPPSDEASEKSEVVPEPIAPAEDQTAINLRNLREAKEKAEKERDELVNYFKQVQQQNKPQQQEDDPYKEFGIIEDDYVEGKQFVKMAKELKEVQKQIEIYKQQSQAIEIENRLKSKYKDFDDVVNEENIIKLREENPDLATALGMIPDTEKQALSVYSYLKKMGFGAKEVNYDKEKERVRTNASKPRPLTSVSPQQGDSPLSHANAFQDGLTEELSKKLYEETVKFSKGR